MWNEPDLTTYFDYSSTGTAFFAGNSEDYTQMYSASDAGLRVSPALRCCMLACATGRPYLQVQVSEAHHAAHGCELQAAGA